MRFGIRRDNGAGQQVCEAAITAERRFRRVFVVVMMMVVPGIAVRHVHRHGQAVGTQDKPRTTVC